MQSALWCDSFGSLQGLLASASACLILPLEQGGNYRRSFPLSSSSPPPPPCWGNGEFAGPCGLPGEFPPGSGRRGRHLSAKYRDGKTFSADLLSYLFLFPHRCELVQMSCSIYITMSLSDMQSGIRSS